MYNKIFPYKGVGFLMLEFLKCRTSLAMDEEASENK